ncbi:MAG TPA: hypothetical protein VLF66_16270, partial [Thermoanaerobaculia bacterium]|nr:hypothetical protein [Thermoanaerobaculia bacterium]
MIGAACLLALALGCRDHPQTRLSEALAAAQLEEPPDGLVRALEVLTRGTRYDDRWVLNPASRQWDGVAVFLLREDTDWQALGRRYRPLATVQDNCRAFLDEQAVLCDAGFPGSFLHRHLGTTDQLPSFLWWLVGHELGHLAEGTEGNHSLRSEGARPSIRTLESQRREYGADCWMIRQMLTQGTPQERLALEVLALDLVNSRFRETETSLPAGVGIIFDYNRAEPYDFVGIESHPDLILRSLRVMHVSATETDQPAL